MLLIFLIFLTTIGTNRSSRFLDSFHTLLTNNVSALGYFYIVLCERFVAYWTLAVFL